MGEHLNVFKEGWNDYMYVILQKWSSVCFLSTKYTAKFKNWILEKSFSPPITELDCKTKQKT